MNCKRNRNRSNLGQEISDLHANAKERATDVDLLMFEMRRKKLFLRLTSHAFSATNRGTAGQRMWKERDPQTPSRSSNQPLCICQKAAQKTRNSNYVPDKKINFNLVPCVRLVFFFVPLKLLQISPIAHMEAWIGRYLLLLKWKLTARIFGWFKKHKDFITEWKKHLGLGPILMSVTV